MLNGVLLAPPVHAQTPQPSSPPTVQQVVQPKSTSTSTATSKPDPLDPRAPVPALRYESALKTSRPAAEEKAVSWREANDTVTRIGGWRVYLREAQMPDTPPVTATSAPAPSAAASAARTTEPRPTSPTSPAANAPTRPAAAQPAQGGHHSHHKP